MERPDAEKLLQKLLAILPENLKPYVKPCKLHAARNYGIRVPITADYLEEISNTWKAYLRKPENQTTEGKQLFITVERPEPEKKQYGMMGKIKDFVTDNADAAATVRPFWYPDFEIHLEEDEMGKDGGEVVKSATLVAKVTLGGKVEWNTAGLRKIGMASEQVANQKLAAFRRRK